MQLNRDSNSRKLKPRKSVKLPPRPPDNLPEIIQRGYAMGGRWAVAACYLDLASSSSMRLAEILSLRRDHIRDGVARFFGKGRKERVVPIHPDILPHLPAEGPLFPYNRRSIERWVSALGRSCGVRLWPHLGRHAFVWQCVRKNINLLDVAVITGHTSLATLQGYYNADANRIKSVASKIWA